MHTHLDLFSGIGGFALAARAAGFQTVAFCEADERCRTFLERRWGVPVIPDIRGCDFSRFRGVTLLTGGPPCQPASRAGKQGGAEDDRWLWGEAVRAVAEARPDWFVFENPLGILDVGLDGILDDLEALGYEVAPPFDVPACAVDSPQLRHRLWIVGHANGGRALQREGSEREEWGRAGDAGENSLVNTHNGHGRESDEIRAGRDAVAVPVEADGVGPVANSTEQSGEQQFGRDQLRHEGGEGAPRRDSQDDVADPSRNCEGGIREEAGADRERTREPFEHDGGNMADAKRERRERGSAEPGEKKGAFGATPGLHWSNSVWVPCEDGKFRRAPDDSFDVVDGLHRSLLGALGNSIVPQCATEILKAIARVIRET